jgi:hypothetical protein
LIELSNFDLPPYHYFDTNSLDSYLDNMPPKASPRTPSRGSEESTSPERSPNGLLFEDLDNPKIKKEDLLRVIRKYQFKHEAPQPGWLRGGKRADTKARLLAFLREKRRERIHKHLLQKKRAQAQTTQPLNKSNLRCHKVTLDGFDLDFEHVELNGSRGNCLAESVSYVLWGTRDNWRTIKENVKKMWDNAMKKGTFMHSLRYNDYNQMETGNVDPRIGHER